MFAGTLSGDTKDKSLTVQLTVSAKERRLDVKDNPGLLQFRLYFHLSWW